MVDYVNRSRSGYDVGEVLATGTITTSGNTASGILVGENVELDVVVGVGAVGGTTPTFDLVIEESDDGSTSWTSAGTVRQVVEGDANSTVKGMVRTSKKYVRGNWTVAGAGATLGIEAYIGS